MATKSKKRRISLKDLITASMDPNVQAQLKEKSGIKLTLAGEDLNAVKIFAHMTLDVARQRNPDITQAQLVANLISNLQRVKPTLRKIMLEQMKRYISE